MPSDDPLRHLEAWYLAQCDGDWEHEFGVSIETLDNPCWRMRIDLCGADLAECDSAREEQHQSEHVRWRAGSRTSSSTLRAAPATYERQFATSSDGRTHKAPPARTTIGGRPCLAGRPRFTLVVRSRPPS
ncbi:MAG: hypothetical protein JHC95_12210 [Solirubrobacteraceae bacterium]|nr:hypothetical protein [Solirubrobacteraceae bacterium]